MMVSDDAVGKRYNTACYKRLSDEQVKALHEHKLLGTFIDAYLLTYREANEDKNADDKKQGEKAVNALLKAYPNSGYAQYIAGSYYLRYKNFKQASNYLAKAVELWPDDSMIWYAYAYSEDGNDNYQTAYTAAAIASQIDPWTDDYSRDPYGIALHADSLKKQLETAMNEEATVVFDATEEQDYGDVSASDYHKFAEDAKDNDNNDAYYYYNTLALLSENADKETIQKSFDMMSDHTSKAYYFLRGEWSRRFEAKNYTIDVWSQCYDKYPSWDYACLQLGLAVLENGDYTSANEFFRRAALNNDGNPLAFGYLAYTYYLIGDEDKLNETLQYLAYITEDIDIALTDQILESFGVDKKNTAKIESVPSYNVAAAIQTNSVTSDLGKYLGVYMPDVGEKNVKRSTSGQGSEYAYEYANSSGCSMKIVGYLPEGYQIIKNTKWSFEEAGETTSKAASILTEAGAANEAYSILRPTISIAKENKITGYNVAGDAITIAASTRSLINPAANSNKLNPAVEAFDNYLSALQAVGAAASYTLPASKPIMDKIITGLGLTQEFLNSVAGQALADALMDNDLGRWANTTVAEFNAGIMNCFEQGSGQEYINDLIKNGGNINADENTLKRLKYTLNSYQRKRKDLWMEKYLKLSKENQKKYAKWYADKLNEINNSGIGPDGQPVKKPNIYLYPTETAEMDVELGYDELITVSDPLYNEGWHVVANPNGSLEINDETYGYLFYECIISASKFETNEGFVIPADKREEAFRNILEEYGLNEQEINDFVEYWIEELVSGYDYIMYPQTEEMVDEAMPLTLSVEPDSIFRIWFAFERVEDAHTLESVVTPQVSKFERVGFSVVEWGGMNLN